MTISVSTQCRTAAAAAVLLFGLQGWGAEPEYAGSDSCQTCHEDIHNQFFKANRHAGLETDKRRGWETRACESCHGPGAKHAESTDKADILNPKRMGAGEADRGCLKCHAGERTQVGRVLSGHGRNQVACSGCHSIHATEPAVVTTNRAVRINEQCAACHMDHRAAFQRPHTHPLAARNTPNQPMACTDCHNPHGTFLAKNVSQMIGGEPGCLRCHADKRGPFAFEHSPVRLEGCQSCHEPHGSANPRMLTRHNVAQQCLECHANILTQAGVSASGALGGIPPAFHDLRSARFRNCTICHQKIHGSHVNKAFLR